MARKRLEQSAKDLEATRQEYVPRRGDHVRFVYKEPDPNGVIEKAFVEDEDWNYSPGKPMTVGDHEFTSGDSVEILLYAACSHNCGRCGPLPGGKPAGPRR